MGNSTNVYHYLINDQLQLGLPATFQGFWAKSWDTALHAFPHSTDNHTYLEDKTDVIPGLIKLLWTAQFEFWTSHLSSINQRQDNVYQDHHHEKLLQYKLRIRLLHSQRHLCLPGHRDIYFFSDVEEYLHKATGTQMRNYLHQYEQVINQSIKAAKSQPLRTLLSFPGFNRVRPMERSQPHFQHHSQTPASTDTRGTPTNRKHTRWKQVTTSLQSIRRFFTTPPDT